MATKFLSPKLLKLNLPYFLRQLNSSTASSSPLSAIESLSDPTALQQSPPSTSILDLNDHQKLFATLSVKKLMHASLILQMAALEPVVDLGMWVMDSKLMQIDSFVRDAVLKMIRVSFYEHFCGGENSFEAGECIKKMNESGLRGMLDYAVEFTSDDDACHRNFLGFQKTIQAAKSLSSSSVSFVIVKMTAICRLKLLERVSDLLRWQQRDPSFNLPWKQNTLPIFADSSPLYHTLEKPDPLTPQEELELQIGQQRLLTLCQDCADANVPLVVDAEHTPVQPAIDYLTYSSAIIHNKDDNVVVYNTMQAYLKDAKERLLLATEAADKMGIPMGFKLVRGAYMSSERKIASSLGYESPIHNSVQQTHDCYNDCASYLLDAITDRSHGLVIATHNVESGRLAATKARDLGIRNGYHKFEFAQLHGMAEALSFGLRNAGFQVSKYIPYGTLETVIPYLLRRAEENRGMLSASNLDRELMRKELSRRLKAAIF
ncbi:proline dehydrogenase 2, mitochondrial [Mercurialis annua]|uniref:proline dehydrogenase 2, mitochondrial n=1 Tax=Mercurialis annua TaxID=3986 RepID=UPI002161030B|nr:proline dehydrogenase 2, mitochondrial [Mercurialis annua]